MELSGHKLKEKRIELVKSAYRADGKVVKSLKLPLKIEAKHCLNVKTVKDQYEIISGHDKGSLISLIVACHLTGFWLFETGGKSNAFRNEHISDTYHRQFINEIINKEQIEDISGLNRFNLGDFYQVFKKQARSKAYTYEEIKKRIYLFLASTDAKLANFSILTSMLENFINEAKEKLDGWGEFASVKGVKLFDEVASMYFNFPKLEKMETKFKPLAPKYSTLSYANNVLKTCDINTEISIYQVCAQKLHYLRQKDLPLNAKTLQSMVTTGNASGLSWLFGAGLAYWKSSSIEEIATDYNTDDLTAISALKSYFDSVHDPLLFKDKNYSDYRTTVQGKIDSWIANYFKRLFDIESMLTDIEDLVLPDALYEKPAVPILRSLNTSTEVIDNLITSIAVNVNNTKKSVDVLLGKLDKLPSKKDVDNLELLGGEIDTLVGIIKSFNNQLDMRIKGEDEHKEKNFYKSCIIDLPKSLMDIPKLNRFSGGIPNYKEEIQDAVKKFNSIRKARANHFNEILSFFNKNKLNTDFDKAFLQIPMIIHHKVVNKKTLVKGFLLNKVVELRKVLSHGSCNILASILKREEIFTKKDANRIIEKKIGVIFKKPYDRNKRKLYLPEHYDFNVMLILEELRDTILAELIKDDMPSRYLDVLNIENLIYNIKLQIAHQLKTIPTELLKINALEQFSKVPFEIKVLVNAKTVPSNLIIKIFTLYNGQLRGMGNLLFRREFFLNYSFSRAGKNIITYLPKKNKIMTLPEHVKKGDNSLSRTVAKYKLNADEIVSDKAFSLLFESKEIDNDTKSFLKQLPHGFCVGLDLKEKEQKNNILRITKKGLKFIKSTNVQAKITCPSKFHKYFIDVLDGKSEFGDYALLFEHTIEQKAHVFTNGDIEVSLEDASLRCNVSIPITQKAENIPGTKFKLSNKFVAFDIGEFKIGWAVFDVATRSLIKYGKVKCTHINSLKKYSEKYRGWIQPRQKYTQKAQNKLEQMRKNTVGHILTVIENIIFEYQAFPVIEAPTMGDRSESSIIIEKLMHYLSYSPTAIHKTERKSHWMGGDLWVHPTLVKLNKQKNDLMIVSPGIASSNYATSQVCSKCGRNPVAAIFDTYDREDKIKVINGCIQVKLKANPKGEFGRKQLGEFKLKVLTNRNSTWTNKQFLEKLKSYRRINQTMPYKYEMEDGEYQRSDILTMLDKYSGQPAKQVQQKDSQKAYYHCAFEECDHSQHSEENAAINQGNKFLLSLR